MKKRAVSPRAALAVVLSLSTSAAWAEEHSAAPQQAVDAAALFKKSCRNCHGPRAQGLASYPKLNDKEPDHLTLRLEQYRAKERLGPNSPLMWPHAVDLSDAEIAALAGYISTAFD